MLLERTQLPPPTLYRYFRDLAPPPYNGGKDGLIVAVVTQWTVDWQAWMDQVLSRRGSPQDRVARLFTELERWLKARQWRGSLAANAAAEIADPNHPVHKVIANHRSEVRDRLRALAAEAGVADPSDAARLLQVLLDGAMAGARMEHGPGPVRVARDAARLVLASN